MNIKILSLGICFLFVLLQNVFSAPIDVRRARDIAAGQLQLDVVARRGGQDSIRLVYTSGGIPTRGVSEQQDYYVFARNGSGYVVVSGDDNLPEVLGYSYESQFDAGNIPLQMRTWLNQYALWVQAARKHGVMFYSTILETEKTPIAPLLGGLLWEQTGVFNTLTPMFGEDHAPVGCVATALTQIMRYHAWPRKGRGAIKYKLGKQSLYQKFDTPYDWENMPNVVTEESTPAQKKAVSILSRDVGYACQMQYEKESSAATSENAMIAMRKYMRYANTIRLRNQDYYDYDEWIKICLDELKGKRPVYYSGGAVGVGHAFVCDGYDGSGRFHFNWGWGGLSNGYFVLTHLEPAVQSTGGGGEGGYVLSNQMITGLQPQDANEDEMEFICDKVTLPIQKLQKTTPIQVTLEGFWNYSYGNFTVSTALQIFDDKGNKVLEMHDAESEVLSFRYGYNKAQLKVNANALPDGEYTVRPAVYFPNTSSYLSVRLGVLHPTAKFRVEGNDIFFTTKSKVANLALIASSQIVNMNVDNVFEFTIQNNSSLPYRSIIAGIYSEAQDKLTIQPKKREDLLFNRSISLQPGEKQTFTLLLDGPKKESQRYMHILYDSEGGSEDRFPSLSDGTSFPGKSKFLTVNLTLESSYSFAKYVGTTPPYVPPYEFTYTNFTTYESGTPMRVELKLKAPVSKGAKARILGAVFGPVVAGKRSLVAPIMRLGTVVLRPNEERSFVMEQVVNLAPGSDYRLQFYDSNEQLRQLKHSFHFTVTGAYSNSLPIPDNSSVPDGPDNFDGSNKDMSVLDGDANLLEGVSFAPNPTSGFMNLYFDTTLAGLTVNVDVIDITGQKLQHIEKMVEKQLRLDVSSLSKGLYLLCVQCDGKQTTLRFVVDK